MTGNVNHGLILCAILRKRIVRRVWKILLNNCREIVKMEISLNIQGMWQYGSGYRSDCHVIMT